MVSTGRRFPPGLRAAVGWTRGRRPPSRPGLSLSGRRSGWWRGAPSSAWGDWAAATELGAEQRGGLGESMKPNQGAACVADSGLTVDVEARSAGHDACVVLCGHGVPTGVLFQGWLDDHTQVSTVVLVHAGTKGTHLETI